MPATLQLPGQGEGQGWLQKAMRGAGSSTSGSGGTQGMGLLQVLLHLPAPPLHGGSSRPTPTAHHRGLLHTLSGRQLLPWEAQSYAMVPNSPALQRRTASLHTPLPEPKGLTWIRC